jgi:propionyl-CoA carboxylase alpha chain
MHEVLINDTYINRFLILVQVSPGAELAVVEAMKMRNVLRAEQEGIVKAVPAKVGSVLASDQVIIEFE